MDPLFENHIKITKGLLKEFAKETYYVLNKKIRLLCLMMFFVEVFVFILGFVYSGFSFSSSLFLILFLSAFFLFMFFKGYVFKLREENKNLKSLHGELPRSIKKFYKNHFEVVTNRSNLTIEYSQITKVLETKNLFIIMIGNQGALLSRKNFTNANFYEFRNFIGSKISTKE